MARFPSLLVLSVLVVIQGALGHRCYDCGEVDRDAGARCERDPGDVVVECPSNKCFTAQIVYPGPGNWTVLGCADRKNELIHHPVGCRKVEAHDPTSAYVCICKEDLCNGASAAGGTNLVAVAVAVSLGIAFVK